MNMPFHALGDTVIKEAQTVISKIDDDEARDLASAIVAANRVFVTGEGRTGLLVNALAVRLVQIGLEVHILGEPISPRVRGADLVIAVSGSGETATTLALAESGHAAGAILWAITGARGSRLSRLADRTLVIPGQTKERLVGQVPSMQPLSNLFGQALLIALDVIGLIVMEARGESDKTMRERHADF